MPYIDRDAIPYLAANDGTVYVAMKQYIDKVPDADVVPKAEYDRLKFQFDALDHECDRMERAEDEKNQIIKEQRERLNEYKHQIIELQEELDSIRGRSVACLYPHCIMIEKVETETVRKIFADIRNLFSRLLNGDIKCQQFNVEFLELMKKYKVED